jgi:hypothetical protein
MADEPGQGIAGWVRSEWEKGDLALSQERRDFWLNYAFIEGEQWVYWHPQSREVAEFPRGRGDDRVRLVANRMQPNLVTLLAKLSKQNLSFEVLPSAADDAELTASRLGEHLLECHRVDQGWESLRRDNLFNVFLGATAAIAVEWDPNCGEQLGVNPETNEPIGEGNIALSALAITEFTLEPGTRNPRDSRWVIIASALPPEQVREKYRMDHAPEADTTLASGPLQRRLWNERGFPSNVELSTVFTYYRRPTHKDRGRHVVVCGQEVLHDGPWPFPFKNLNVHVFRQQQLPKRWTGHTMLTDARPLQVAYNAAISNLSEHMKLAGNARLAIPDTSGIEDEDLSDTPGEIVRYDGSASAPPAYIAPPNLPRWLIDHTNRLEDKLDDVMCVHDISRGQAPGDRNSGLALSVLAEKDETPLGMMAHDQAEGWGQVASQVLELWEANVPEQRTARVQNETGIPYVTNWTGRQLRGQTRATVPLDAVLPHSRVALQAWIMSIGEKFPQAMPQNPAVLARMMDLPSSAMFGEMADADVAQAISENHLMSVGIVPALEDDDPFPQEYDNHAVHIAEHNRLRKSRAYIYAPPEVRRIVDAHIVAHEQLARDQAIDQAELNAARPGAGALPQANEPAGSAVPPDFMERQAAALGSPPAPGGMPALPPGPAPAPV